MLLARPSTGVPTARAWCVAGLPPLQMTRLARAAARSPGKTSASLTLPGQRCRRASAEGRRNHEDRKVCRARRGRRAAVRSGRNSRGSRTPRVGHEGHLATRWAARRRGTRGSGRGNGGCRAGRTSAPSPERRRRGCSPPPCRRDGDRGRGWEGRIPGGHGSTARYGRQTRRGGRAETALVRSVGRGAWRWAVPARESAGGHKDSSRHW